VGPGRDSPQLRVTTLGQQQHSTPPRGRLRGRHVAREDDILQGINSESGPHGKVPDPCIYRPGLWVRSRAATGAKRTPRMGFGPLCVGSRPLTIGSRDSGTENTEKSPRGGVNRAKLKFTNLIITTSRVSVRNIIESEREGAKQIASE
jgi:hypothetical protein